MKLVIDTNVLLVSISSKSKYHWLFQSLLNGDFIICITHDILTEYEEIISKHMGLSASNGLLGLFDNLSNVEFLKTYYQFNLIVNDPDDNKFVDCTIAGSADYLVSNDNHFKVLKKIEFPKIEVLNIQQLKELLNK